MTPDPEETEEDRIWREYFEERMEHRERLADKDDMLFDDRVAGEFNK